MRNLEKKNYPERLVKNQGKFKENKDTESIRSKRKKLEKEKIRLFFVNNEKKKKSEIIESNI